MEINFGEIVVDEEEKIENIELDTIKIQGSTDYDELKNKPSINDITLEGNKTLEELGIQPSGDYVFKEDVYNKEETYNKKEFDVLIPKNTSQLTNDSGFIVEETDPTVPDWAKASTKPTYDYTEITGTPNIPKNTSELNNDSGFVDENYIEEKINSIPVNDLLHFKGHVETVDDLPSTGQSSASEVAPIYILTNPAYTDLTTHIKDSNKTNVINLIKSGQQYYIGACDGFYNPTRYCCSTNYPECIDGINLDDGKILVHIKYDANKPVYVDCNSDIGNLYARIRLMVYDDATYSAQTSSFQVTKSGWFVMGAKGTATNFTLYGNLPHSLKYKVRPSSFYQTSSSSPYASAITQTSYNTFINAVDNFKYADGYTLIKFENELAKFILSESEATPNDVYTVGENKDIYRCNESPAWELWSGGSGEDTEPVEALTNIQYVTTTHSSTSTPFIFEGKKPGIYLFKGNQGEAVYFRGSSSNTFQVKANLEDNILYIVKEYTSDLQQNEMFAFAKCSGSGVNDTPSYVTFEYTSSGTAGLSFRNQNYVYATGSNVKTLYTTTQQTIVGKKTFNTLPESSVVPTTDNQLVNKAYVDGLIGDVESLLGGI